MIASSAVLGLVFCLLFNIFNGITSNYNSDIKLGYLDNDQSLVSASIKSYLGEQLQFTLVEDNPENLQRQLVDKHVSLIIQVPPGFGKAVIAGSDAKLTTTFMDDYENHTLISSIVEQYCASLDVLATAAGGSASRFEQLLVDASQSVAPITVTHLSGDVQLQNITSLAFVNVLGFFLIISSMLGMAIASLLSDDRTQGVYARMRTTTLNALTYVAGICAAGFVMVLTMMLVFFGYLFATGQGQLLPLWQMFILCLIFGVYVVSFALFCGVYVNGKQSILWLFVCTATIFSLMGGAFFPIDYAPQLLQQLAHLVPTYWFSEAKNILVLDSSGSWMFAAGVLSLYIVFFALATAIRFAGRSRSAP
jgi:ABC-2 type transport system permease protein